MDTLYLDITDSTPKQVRHVERVLMQDQEAMSTQLFGMPIWGWLAVLVPIAVLVIAWLIWKSNRGKEAREVSKRKAEELRMWLSRYLNHLELRAEKFAKPGASKDEHQKESGSSPLFQFLDAGSMESLIHPNGKTSTNGRFERYLDLLDTVEQTEKLSEQGNEELKKLTDARKEFKRSYDHLIDFIHEFFTELSTSVSADNPPGEFLLKLFEIRNEWYVQIRNNPGSEYEISYRELFTPLGELCATVIRSNDADSKPFILKEKIDRLLLQREALDQLEKETEQKLGDYSKKIREAGKDIQACGDYLSQLN